MQDWITIQQNRLKDHHAYLDVLLEQLLMACTQYARVAIRNPGTTSQELNELSAKIEQNKINIQTLFENLFVVQEYKQSTYQYDGFMTVKDALALLLGVMHKVPSTIRIEDEITHARQALEACSQIQY